MLPIRNNAHLVGAVLVCSPPPSWPSRARRPRWRTPWRRLGTPRSSCGPSCSQRRWDLSSAALTLVASSSIGALLSLQSNVRRSDGGSPIIGIPDLLRSSGLGRRRAVGPRKRTLSEVRRRSARGYPVRPRFPPFRFKRLKGVARTRAAPHKLRVPTHSTSSSVHSDPAPSTMVDTTKLGPLFAKLAEAALEISQVFTEASGAPLGNKRSNDGVDENGKPMKKKKAGNGHAPAPRQSPFNAQLPRRHGRTLDPAPSRGDLAQLARVTVPLSCFVPSRVMRVPAPRHNVPKFKSVRFLSTCALPRLEFAPEPLRPVTRRNGRERPLSNPPS